MSMTQSTVSAQDLFMMFLSVGSSMPGPFVAPIDRSSEARALFEGLAVNGTIAFSLLEDGSVAVRFGLQFADPNAIYGIYLLRKPTARYSPVSPVSPALTEPPMGESTEIVYKNRRITICWEASPATVEKQQQQQQQPTSSLPDTSPYLASDSYTVACNDLLSEQEQILAQYASLTPPLDEYTPPTPPNAQYEQSQQQFEFHQQQQQQQQQHQQQLQQLQQQQEQQQREQMELEQLQVMPENVLYDLTPYLYEQCSTGCPSVIQGAYGIHALASREIVIKRNDRVIARSTVMKVFN